MSAKIQNMDQYNTLYKESMENTDDYWKEIAQNFEWFKPANKILQGNFTEGNVKWFEDAELNITVNALDRHVKTQPDKIAFYFEGNEPNQPTISYTYKELLERVCQMANVLKQHDIKKGDPVCLYMSMVPELLIAALACARIGAPHSIVFGGFSAQALGDRINNLQTKLLITNDESYRGSKTTPLKSIADEALKNNSTVKNVLVLKHTGGEINWVENRDKWLSPLLDRASSECAAEKMNGEDPLFILYTSGSTGAPKGLVHTTAGYMVWAAETFKQVFDVNDKDVFWCTADMGWVTGHSYIIYGPLLNGATQVVFEGIPSYPDAGRFWNIIDKYKVSHFYTAPTAIRALMQEGEEFINKSDLSSLKVLGSVGEPINEEAWLWYHEKVGKGKCPIVDTWWQTETGGIMISPLANVSRCIPSYATIPLPGGEAILVDNDGKEIKEMGVEGNLCFKRPWPGIARTIFNDHERYMQTYFSTYPGLYFSGDGARRDQEGNFRITGRVDDVMNISGHRIGTAEVEAAINQHTSVVESAVIGYPHEIKGQGIIAFVTPFSMKKCDEETISKELNDLIVKNIGPIAKLDKLVLISELPKTRSGKILRRILRKLAAGEGNQLGDTSTLLNPETIDIIKEKLK